MKNILITGLSVLLLLACTKEEIPVASEVKNIYEIVEKPDMDEIDRKIYDIWQKYEVPIYLNDTISATDYGERDTLGNIIYSYHILYPNRDISSPSYTPTFTRMKWRDPEVRAKLMPLLEFLDEELLPLARKLNINIPVLLLLDKGAFRGINYHVFRGPNCMLMTTTGFKNDQASKTAYRTHLFCLGKGKYYNDILDPYYRVTEELVKANGYSYTYNIWGLQYQYIVSDFPTIFSNVYFLLRYESQMKTLRAQLETAKKKYETTGAIADFKAYSDKLAQIYAREVVKTEEETWMKRYEENCGAAFGFLGMPTPATTSAAGTTQCKEQDLLNYLDLLVKYPMSELEKTYEAYPAILKRLKLLDEGLKSHNISLDLFR